MDVNLSLGTSSVQAAAEHELGGVEINILSALEIIPRIRAAGDIFARGRFVGEADKWGKETCASREGTLMPSAMRWQSRWYSPVDSQSNYKI